MCFVSDNEPGSAMHLSTSDFSSKFGAHALPAWREAVRRLGAVMPANRVGMWGASALRKLSLAGSGTGLSGPHDIEVAGQVRARLYPASNRCEKRAYCGVQTWDAPERQALSAALEESVSNPFVFLDVGANVGLYSLFLHDAAVRLNRNVQIVAIEPDPENRARLEFNIAASGGDMIVEKVGISGEAGKGVMAGGDVNRGSTAVHQDVDVEGALVELETLASLVSRHKLQRIDAMKMDIEGYDEAALAAFFKQAPESTFPELLIVEVGKVVDSPIVRLARQYGYVEDGGTPMNAVLRRNPSLADANAASATACNGAA